jgi:hypothetical protein
MGAGRFGLVDIGPELKFELEVGRDEGYVVLYGTGSVCLRSSITAASFFDFRRLKWKKTAITTNIMKATPPTTPPTIAPILVLLLLLPSPDPGEFEFGASLVLYMK